MERQEVKYLCSTDKMQLVSVGSMRDLSEPASKNPKKMRISRCTATSWCNAAWIHSHTKDDGEKLVMLPIAGCDVWCLDPPCRCVHGALTYVRISGTPPPLT